MFLNLKFFYSKAFFFRFHFNIYWRVLINKSWRPGCFISQYGVKMKWVFFPLKETKIWIFKHTVSKEVHLFRFGWQIHLFFINDLMVTDLWKFITRLSIPPKDRVKHVTYWLLVCSTWTLQNFNPVDLVFASIFDILLFYIILCPQCDVTSHLICINQNLE